MGRIDLDGGYLDGVYLDNNATTRVDPAVVAAMVPYFSEAFGNGSSKHAFGEASAIAIRLARSQVQRLIGAASEQEIIFTSGGTESDNAAILSALDAQPGRNEIITSQVEHPAVLALCDHLVRSGRAKVHYVGVDSHGRLDVAAFERLLSDKTACVSFMWANNETGVVFPIAQLAALAHAAGALFHTDAVQAAGKVPVNVAAAGVDMASLSAHKFHGPKGIGALSVRKGVKFQPLLRGGRQERGRRAGTENVPAIAGFGKAAELALQALGSAMPAVEALRNTLADLLVARIDGALVLGVGAPRVPNTLDIAFEGIESDSMLLRLDQAGIAASSGSACSSGSMEPSHVLRAMKVPFGFIHGAVRLSLSRETTAAQIDYAASVLPKIIGKLRESTLAAPISEPGVLVGDRP